jgi:hypothetical protein
LSSTYTIQDALTVVGSVYRNAVKDDMAPTIADIAYSKIWNAADWRQTLAELPPFYLVPLEQDYGSPLVTIPSNFLGFRKVNCVQNLDDPAFRYPLDVRKNLSEEYYQGQPEFISYEVALSKFRVYPRPSQAIGASDWMIEGTYKKQPTKITPDNMGSTIIPVDDRYFSVYVQALRWAYLDLVGDPKAGAVQYEKRSRGYVVTGELAKLYAAIEDMAEQEAVELGDDSIAPAAPLLW